MGSTGFVGENLRYNHEFEALCHSTDIDSFYDCRPNICIYAGVPAAMYLANSDPGKDLNIMRTARENIRRIRPDKLVLISTVAVYSHPKDVDERTLMIDDELSVYGKNRLQLEQWVREDYPEALIVRLPALYGKGLKKNFLYDLHTIVPSMLNHQKYSMLKMQSIFVKEGYSLNVNGFYSLREDANINELKQFFKLNDFNALSFTDSRSRYQFYNLGRLWSDIEIAREEGIDVMNLSTPPVSALEVYEYVTSDTNWKNEILDRPYDYNMKSLYSHVLGGCDGYLCTKQDELDGIKQFIEKWE